MSTKESRFNMRTSLPVLAFAILYSSGVSAQTTPSDATAPQTADAAAIQNGAIAPENANSSATQSGDIVVTGSRTARNGAEAPTPVTVLGANLIAERGSPDIASTLNELPALANSTTPGSTATLIRSTGANYANLRGLGANRTLTLVDGLRFTPSADTGQIDLNLLPTILVDRIDIVTGGASAVYGSDAVAGVVNVVLLRKFEGLKLEAQGGVAEVGDSGQRRVSGLAGTSFAGGRGHVEIAGEYAKVDSAGDMYSRDWGAKEKYILSNPNGQPTLILADNVHSATMAPGGIITSGPLRGTTFNDDGTPRQFNYGTFAGAQYMIGGEGNGNTFFKGVLLTPSVERRVATVRASYELTSSIEFSVDGFYGWTQARGSSVNPFDFGNDTISIDNPYIPQALRARMVATGVTSFQFGRLWTDFGNAATDAVNETKHIVGALRGEFGSGWKWNASISHGTNQYDQYVTNAFVVARKNDAIDAVMGPNGTVVCRSTLTNPGNGCVPVNLFGIGNSSAAAFNYLRATQEFHELLRQTAANVSLTGSPFQIFGRDVSVAVGGDYRRSSARGTADALGQADSFAYGNYKPIAGAYSVKEAFLEAELPLFHDIAFFKSFNLNGAVRYTDYSISGGVTSWKGGATWDVNSSLRFRVTRSRDIRAPNLAELFTPPRTNTPANIIDPARGNATAFANSTTAGSLLLKPEAADTLTAGVVVTPLIVPRLQFSFDYYDIDLKNAIGTISEQNIVDRCYAGDQALCANITRTNGIITAVQANFINIAQFQVRGFDIEASYSLPVGSGKLDFRVLANHVLRNRQVTGGIAVDYAGQNGPDGVVDWTATGLVNAHFGPFSALIEERFINGGNYNNQYRTGIDISNNHIPSVFYTNLTLQTEIKTPGTSHSIQVYGVVNNLFDKDPPLDPVVLVPTNIAYYDVLGRTFTVGARIKF